MEIKDQCWYARHTYPVKLSQPCHRELPTALAIHDYNSCFGSMNYKQRGIILEGDETFIHLMNRILIVTEINNRVGRCI